MEPGTECDLPLIMAAAMRQCSNMQWFNLLDRRHTSVFYIVSDYSDIYLAFYCTVEQLILELEAVSGPQRHVTRFNAGVFAAYFVFPCD